jgi:hypothetical protein
MDRRPGTASRFSRVASIRSRPDEVPTWRVLAPDGDFIILAQFDLDKPEQRERFMLAVNLDARWQQTIRPLAELLG